jgi:hypothetical protein
VPALPAQPVPELRAVGVLGAQQLNRGDPVEQGVAGPATPRPYRRPRPCPPAGNARAAVALCPAYVPLLPRRFPPCTSARVPAPQGWCRAIIGRRHCGPIYHDHPCVRRRWASCRARAGGPGQRVRRDAGGRSTIPGAILIPAGRRAGGRFPGSAPWRAGRVSHRSRPPAAAQTDQEGGLAYARGWPVLAVSRPGRDRREPVGMLTAALSRSG